MTVRYWPHSRPIPRGWVYHTDLAPPHGFYSVLLRRLTLLERLERGFWWLAFLVRREIV